VDDGWRIELVETGVNPDGPPRPRWMAPAAGVLVLTFLVGVALVMSDQAAVANYVPGIVLCGSMFGLIAIIVVRAHAVKRSRAGWVQVDARCVDHEFRLVPLQGGNANLSAGWIGRMVCEFEFGGMRYRTTPAVCWSNLRGREYDFSSERGAQAFFDRHVTTGGSCVLRVNRQNPLEGMLV
jgi:hypothetical protein